MNLNNIVRNVSAILFRSEYVNGILGFIPSSSRSMANRTVYPLESGFLLLIQLNINPSMDK